MKYAFGAVLWRSQHMMLKCRGGFREGESPRSKSCYRNRIMMSNVQRYILWCLIFLIFFILGHGVILKLIYVTVTGICLSSWLRSFKAIKEQEQLYNKWRNDQIIGQTETWLTLINIWEQPLCVFLCGVLLLGHRPFLFWNMDAVFQAVFEEERKHFYFPEWQNRTSRGYIQVDIFFLSFFFFPPKGTHVRSLMPQLRSIWG